MRRRRNPHRVPEQHAQEAEETQGEPEGRPREELAPHDAEPVSGAELLKREGADEK